MMFSMPEHLTVANVYINLGNFYGGFKPIYYKAKIWIRITAFREITAFVSAMMDYIHQIFMYFRLEKQQYRFPRTCFARFKHNKILVSHYDRVTVAHTT